MNAMIIAKLKELESKATPRPWSYDTNKYGSSIYEGGFAMGAGFRKPEDAELIAEMRNALPKLLAVVEAAGKFNRHITNPWDGEYRTVLFQCMDKLGINPFAMQLLVESPAIRKAGVHTVPFRFGYNGTYYRVLIQKETLDESLAYDKEKSEP